MTLSVRTARSLDEFRVAMEQIDLRLTYRAVADLMLDGWDFDIRPLSYQTGQYWIGVTKGTARVTAEGDTFREAAGAAVRAIRALPPRHRGLLNRLRGRR